MVQLKNEKETVFAEKAMGINSSLHSVVDPLLRAIHTLLVQEDETIKPKVFFFFFFLNIDAIKFFMFFVNYISLKFFFLINN